MKEIYFDKEAKELLIEGVRELTKAVKSTMGPNGSTVIIPSEKEVGKYKVTKDGVSVAKSIFFEDAVKNIGAQLVKQAAEKTVDEAGDSTTSSTVLTCALVEKLNKYNFRDVSNKLDQIIPEIIKNLKLNSKPLNVKEVKYVASISANNDLQIGDTIQQAYNHSSIVKVEESNNLKDELHLINGMMLNTSYMSKHFITNIKKGECELDNPYVVIIDGKLDNLDCIKNILEPLAKNNETLLIITEYVNENVLRVLETNVLSDAIKLCVIKSPGFSTHRKDLLLDISRFTGATIITNTFSQYQPNILGRLQNCKIGKNNSILLKHEGIQLDNLIEQYKEFLNSNELEEHDKELLRQRIQNLEGKVSVIKVGGKTENEMIERFDRYDDAVKAVACALEEGIIEGGGVALKKISDEYESSYDYDHILVDIMEALLAPFNTIQENGIVIDTTTSMFEQHIVDPLKAIRCALENAVSTAKVILSTNSIVLSRQEWKN